MRKCIYTAIIGGYDTPFPSNDGTKTEGWDYLCFTDSKELKSDFWTIIYVEKPENISSAKFARNIKIEWYKWVSEYDVHIWKDANLVIKTNLDDFLELKENHSMLIFKHWERNCLYEEGDIVVRLRRANAIDVGIQLSAYTREGYPRQNGLVETGVSIRDNNLENQEFSELWWNQIIQFTERDQLSFNYVLWKKPIDLKIIPSELRNNNRFLLKLHNR